MEQRKAWADTIMIYSMEGLLKSQFTNPDMKKALYVAVNSAQEIIVTDYHLNTLFIYDHQGKRLPPTGVVQRGEGGREGEGEGEMKRLLVGVRYCYRDAHSEDWPVRLTARRLQGASVCLHRERR